MLFSPRRVVPTVLAIAFVTAGAFLPPPAGADEGVTTRSVQNRTLSGASPNMALSQVGSIPFSVTAAMMNSSNAAVGRTRWGST
jgi:hypothetical protein